MDDPVEDPPPRAGFLTGAGRWLRAIEPRFVLLYGVALVPRLALFPLFRQLVVGGDEVYYWRQATRTFLTYQLRPPLWPLVLKVGRFFSDDPAAGRLLAVFLGALLAPLLFVFVRRLFGSRAAWTAALIAAFYPDHVVWSHFLWSESFVSVLLVLACLAIFPRGGEPPLRPLAGATALGFVFLAKEYALMAFAALALAHLVASEGRLARKVATLALAFLLVLLPTVAFTGAVALRTGRLRIPHAAALGNLRQELHLAFKPGEGEEVIGGLEEARRDPLLADLREDYLRLWGARSFTLWRLSRGHYGEPVGDTVILGMILAHAAIMIVGLTGLLCEPNRAFMTFALGCIASLSLAAVPGYMVSRFRTPFMFLFVIGMARILAEPALLRRGLRSPVRAGAVVIGIVLLVVLFGSTYRGVQWWG